MARASDQRRADRRPAASRAQLWVEGSDAPQEAWLRNLSETGALLQTELLEVGTKVRIVFGSGAEQRDVRATVVRGVHDMPGYRAGVTGIAIRFDS